jgi:DNA transposition AAA+ family ATPase
MDKQQIKTALKAYCDKIGSQNKAENSFKGLGISSATISQVLNENWDLISEDMWRNIAAAIKFSSHQWAIAKTSVYLKLGDYFKDAQTKPKGIDAIVVDSSLGKSIAVDDYVNKTTSTYYIRCNRLLSVRLLIRNMLRSMGKDSSGTTAEMLDNLVLYLQRDSQPLFIIDEVDKLKDEVLEMFIDFENSLHKKCGFVFLSTPYLKKRVDMSVARNKRGFTELYSRMKKIFWDITPNKKEFIADVKSICIANGVTDAETIIEFTNKCDRDFRVLTDLINAYKNQ